MAFFLQNMPVPLFDAGLRRLNVSLDTLDSGRFRELARRDGVDKVLAGLEAAKRAGFRADQGECGRHPRVCGTRRRPAGPLLP